MFSFARFEGSWLPRGAGRDDAGGYRVSDGSAGCICHGPYITISKGAYTAGFYVRRIGSFDLGTVNMDVCAERGQKPFADVSFPVNRLFSTVPGFIKLDFDISEDVSDLEVRLFVPEQVLVGVRELVIFRRDPKAWGA